MGIGFVHLSDIHFGQEKGGKIWIHEDIKNRLIEDVSQVANGLGSGRAYGIIVTGDIAFGGRKFEYEKAADWLDKVAEAAGCEISDIQVVPGNHDIDRAQLTEATKMMLKRIVDEGETALDKFLESDADRELLFRRFSAYRPFAEGYRCPLDTNARLAEEHVAQLAPGRSIRFIRLNSALVCSEKDEEGKLLLGAGQRVLQPRQGEELVVLSHHPMNWFQDSEDAFLFFRNRGRVFISGHEHSPSVEIETTEKGENLMVAAGATVPPDPDGEYTYSYNFIEFDWDPEEDALSVNIIPRAWVNEEKQFGLDKKRLDGGDPRFVLSCPNFRNAPKKEVHQQPEVCVPGASETVLMKNPRDHVKGRKEELVNNTYPLLLLRFFRDISPAQRIEILVSLGAIPKDWTGTLSESFERNAFDELVKDGRTGELQNAIHRILGE